MRCVCDIFVPETVRPRPRMECMGCVTSSEWNVWNVGFCPRTNTFSITSRFDEFLKS